MTEHPYQQPAGYGPTGGGQPATLGVRFGARLIDGLLILVVNIVVVGLVITGLLFGTSTSAFSAGGSGASFVANVVGTLLGVAINLGYFAFMESSRGQTVGKMALSLKVVGPSGGNPTIEQSVKRNIFLAFSIAGIIPFLGIIASLAILVAVIVIAVQISQDDQRRQGWHDKFGDTMVVRTS